MPRRATNKSGAGCKKPDDVKVVQSDNPNISDHESVKEGDVKTAKVTRQYRKRTSKQNEDIKSTLKRGKTDGDLPAAVQLPPPKTRIPPANNPSVDSNEEKNPPAKRHGNKRTSGSGSEPALKKSKTIVQKNLPKNNGVKEVSAEDLAFDSGITCDMCNEAVNYGDDYEAHLRIVHNINKNFNFFFNKAMDARCAMDIKREQQGRKIRCKSDKLDKINKTEQRMMSCILCTQKDGKNLSGNDAVKYHMSVCLFSIGAYTKFLPPKQGDDVKMNMVNSSGTSVK